MNDLLSVDCQDCYLCFYKFAGYAKKIDGWCALHNNHIKRCHDYRNNITINGQQFHFINPLTEPCLDKGR